MRSVGALCQRVTKREPGYSSYECLAHAVRGRGFSRKTLGVALKNFVDKDDFDPKDKRELLDHLELLTNTPRGAENMH
jgi:hypothetical protein